jgi:urea carboxylase
MSARYSWGGDEHLFVEVSEEMSLEAYFKATACVAALRERRPDGVLDICPANAAYQVRFDPDVLEPQALLDLAKEVEHDVGDAKDFDLQTRICEIPVLYGDPWTHETLMRFRDRHQDPDATDLEYAASVNGLDSVEAFVERHSSAPWLASMVGFVAGLPFLYQLVPRDRQLEVPKYVRPRTDTPKQTVGHGGCFGCIYSVRGAGGYQMFGITPMPIYDPGQSLPDFKDFVCFFEPGDILKFEPIDRDRYDALVKEAEDRTISIRRRDVTFRLAEFLEDPDGSNARLLEVLRAD